MIKIRRAVEEDIPEIARLFRISRESALPYLPKLHTPEEDVAFFRSNVYSHQTVYVLKDDDVTIVGFIAFDSDWIRVPTFFWSKSPLSYLTTQKQGILSR